jgi:hypothetical protein
MPIGKIRGEARQESHVATQEYRGKRTRTGNSSGFRFDSALFKSHPEFSGEVKAHVIAPGRLLVTTAEPVAERRDPVIEAFLAFLAQDMVVAPNHIRPLDRERSRRIDDLVRGVQVDADEPLGEEPLL